MVEILTQHAVTKREWTMRDDKAHGAFFGDIPEKDQRVSITLNWKPSEFGKVFCVGRYKLNLPALCEEGYVRKTENGFHLRFQRSGQLIQIATKRIKAPALTVGGIPNI